MYFYVKLLPLDLLAGARAGSKGVVICTGSGEGSNIKAALPAKKKSKMMIVVCMSEVLRLKHESAVCLLSYILTYFVNQYRLNYHDNSIVYYSLDHN